ncbi:MAG: hypothetical protein A3D19_09020 [Deltaproteobacteria bacterium RIFCSPHIGHO2_02_FULL_38_15]|nr:MAG: hypothetical protein A3D19_09020 [Deltaproteobacteria bacterium RIFCSPHIGHO2_02_FULL_38_15]OGQ32514.1 MAG: hypothetical protein A3A72_02920 [Deltaproteobacteria bacterium RIFCSPLOWO2_01_FULL_38_9]OGQ59656.1 MAG: hypothetical protein A3G92_00150 [Deltaproteobacteria bacterium RIFCSPLOWO2_12_FULL_38_8]HBQ21644.1 hypothetical protein [Deltaproteobacteria bacterium]
MQLQFSSYLFSYVPPQKFPTLNMCNPHANSWIIYNYLILLIIYYYLKNNGLQRKPRTCQKSVVMVTIFVNFVMV